jgi:hypothetical protein
MAEKHCLKLQTVCAASGVKTGLQVHHVEPFHFCILAGRPDLEIDARNFIVLSESEKGLSETNYHLLIGHANDFQSSNMTVRDDAKTFFGMSEEAIKSDERWLSREKARCKPWSSWTDQQKSDFRLCLDTLYPLAAGQTPQQRLDELVTELKTK